MLYFAEGTAATTLDEARQGELVNQLLDQLERDRPLRRVLLIPPDITRFDSGAGPLTCDLYRKLSGRAEVSVLPALGTHDEMTPAERAKMYPGIPDEAFLVHHWRTHVERLGEVPADVVESISHGQVRMKADVWVSKHLLETKWDAMISVGQLVPHEVIGIANHIKNILIGVGGPDLLHKSHWLGAVHGMERIMGQARTPVRDLLNWAAEKYLAHLPIAYLLTVRSYDTAGQLVTNGLFAGNDQECFQKGAALSRQVNVTLLDRSPNKVVVYLDPAKFKSTWLGNKAIYRTRMAIADGGELIVLAPNVGVFGEDREIDALIREFGYRGTPHTQKMVAEHPHLAGNLSAAAHLIHGSSEGRFRITYAPGRLSREEITDVGFEYGNLAELEKAYPREKLLEGWNTVGGEEIYFTAHPGAGLWATRERFAGLA